jgi:hypothetical protein
LFRQFLRREQYPFVEAQSGVSSKVYHWINCNRSTSKPGSSWYLISLDWWIRWETILNPNSTEPITTAINKKNSLTKLNKLPNGTDNKYKDRIVSHIPKFEDAGYLDMSVGDANL